MPHSVRFDPRGLRGGNRSNSTSQEILAPSSPAPPMRSASFPAFLNYVGREEVASEVVYGDSERRRANTTSQMEDERETDIFTCTCGQRISRGQITSHMSEECPRRLTKCQYCRAQVKFEDMQVGFCNFYFIKVRCCRVSQNLLVKLPDTTWKLFHSEFFMGLRQNREVAFNLTVRSIHCHPRRFSKFPNNPAVFAWYRRLKYTVWFNFFSEPSSSVPSISSELSKQLWCISDTERRG